MGTHRLFNRDYGRKNCSFSTSVGKYCHLLTNVRFLHPIKKKRFQFDLLLKVFEDDEKAASSTNKRPGTVGRASQSQRENKKTVGLQVRQ